VWLDFLDYRKEIAVLLSFPIFVVSGIWYLCWSELILLTLQK
jgi:hypothetical protein